MGSEMVSLAVIVTRSHDLAGGWAGLLAGIGIPVGKVAVAEKYTGNSIRVRYSTGCCILRQDLVALKLG